MGVERQIPELQKWLSQFIAREARFALEYNGQTSYALMVEFYEKVTPVTALNLVKRIADLAAEVGRLTGERDRQYEFNAGQIAKHAELEATNETLKGLLREWRKTINFAPTPTMCELMERTDQQLQPKREQRIRELERALEEIRLGIVLNRDSREDTLQIAVKALDRGRREMSQ